MLSRCSAAGEAVDKDKTEQEKNAPAGAESVLFLFCFIRPGQGQKVYSARLLTASMTALVVMVAPAIASIAAASTGIVLPTN